MLGTSPRTPGVPEGNVRQRNSWWHMLFVELVASNPELAETVPTEATIFVLPPQDEELYEHNRRLARLHEGPALMVEIEVRDSYADVWPFESKGAGRYALT